MTVGERLKQARKAAKISGQVLGNVIGVSKGQICNIENGTSDLTKANAIVLAEYLGISLEWLLYGKGNLENINIINHTKAVYNDKEKPFEFLENTDCEQRLELAIVEIEGLKREVELYKQMVELLKSR